MATTPPSTDCGMEGRRGVVENSSASAASRRSPGVWEAEVVDVEGGADGPEAEPEGIDASSPGCGPWREPPAEFAWAMDLPMPKKFNLELNLGVRP
jgi:hypothetical protein